jgi:hypothetical protein
MSPAAGPSRHPALPQCHCVLTLQLVTTLFLTDCRHGSVRTLGRDVAFLTVFKMLAGLSSCLIPCTRARIISTKSPPSTDTHRAGIALVCKVMISSFNKTPFSSLLWGPIRLLRNVNACPNVTFCCHHIKSHGSSKHIHSALLRLWLDTAIKSGNKQSHLLF